MKNEKLIVMRLAVQGAFLLFCAYTGWRFYQFYQWAIGMSTVQVPRPPAVEAFLPISALVSLKRLFLTGKYDFIHPAGLTIFLAALVIAFLLRKGFCGWICPVGFCSNLAAAFGGRLKIVRQPPRWLDLPLLAPKYLLLAFFSYLIFVKMNLAAIEGFLRTPYNLAVDAKMLSFFLTPSGISVMIMAFLVTISFFTKNFWCRYLCPYGALLGLLALFGPSNVRRDSEKCISCYKCEKICPGAINITGKKVIRTPECIGCLECIAVCPVPECLSLTVAPRRKAPALLLPIMILTVFLGFWLTALTTGHWHSRIPLTSLKHYYRLELNMPQPK